MSIPSEMLPEGTILHYWPHETRTKDRTKDRLKTARIVSAGSKYYSVAHSDGKTVKVEKTTLRSTGNHPVQYYADADEVSRMEWADNNRGRISDLVMRRSYEQLKLIEQILTGAPSESSGETLYLVSEKDLRDIKEAHNDAWEAEQNKDHKALEEAVDAMDAAYAKARSRPIKK